MPDVKCREDVFAQFFHEERLVAVNFNDEIPGDNTVPTNFPSLNLLSLEEIPNLSALIFLRQLFLRLEGGCGNIAFHRCQKAAPKAFQPLCPQESAVQTLSL